MPQAISKKTVIASLLIGLLYIPFVSEDILRKIPGFYCENLGCIGNGLINFLIGLLIIPSGFALFGFLKAPTEKIKNAATCLGISFLTMCVALLIVYGINQMRIADAIEAAEQACLEHPQLCP